LRHGVKGGEGKKKKKGEKKKKEEGRNFLRAFCHFSLGTSEGGKNSQEGGKGEREVPSFLPRRSLLILDPCALRSAAATKNFSEKKKRGEQRALLLYLTFEGCSGKHEGREEKGLPFAKDHARSTTWGGKERRGKTYEERGGAVMFSEVLPSFFE